MAFSAVHLPLQPSSTKALVVSYMADSSSDGMVEEQEVSDSVAICKATLQAIDLIQRLILLASAETPSHGGTLFRAVEGLTPIAELLGCPLYAAKFVTSRWHTFLRPPPLGLMMPAMLSAQFYIITGLNLSRGLHDILHSGQPGHAQIGLEGSLGVEDSLLQYERH